MYHLHIQAFHLLQSEWGPPKHGVQACRWRSSSPLDPDGISLPPGALTSRTLPRKGMKTFDNFSPVIPHPPTPHPEAHVTCHHRPAASEKAVATLPGLPNGTGGGGGEGGRAGGSATSTQTALCAPGEGAGRQSTSSALRIARDTIIYFPSANFANDAL